MQALQAFVETPEGANLLAGYKRAANILKKEDWDHDREPVRTNRSRDARFVDGVRVAGTGYAPQIEETGSTTRSTRPSPG